MRACILRCPLCLVALAGTLPCPKFTLGVNSTLLGLCIPPTNGDLRDLLWHSICAPRREIQIHLARRSAGIVWGNPISHTGTPHPQPSFRFRTVSAKWTPQPHRSVYVSLVWALCYSVNALYQKLQTSHPPKGKEPYSKINIHLLICKRMIFTPSSIFWTVYPVDQGVSQLLRLTFASERWLL